MPSDDKKNLALNQEKPSKRPSLAARRSMDVVIDIPKVEEKEPPKVWQLHKHWAQSPIHPERLPFQSPLGPAAPYRPFELDQCAGRSGLQSPLPSGMRRPSLINPVTVNNRQVQVNGR